MKLIFKSLGAAGLAIGLSSLAGAASKTMNGMISDSACGMSHAKMIQGHPEAKMSERDCTLACVKAGGKFVFVSGGKVYTIANQNFTALTDHAGETVSLTGDVSGDTVTVSKIAASAKKK